VSRIRHVGFWTIRQIKKKEILRQKIGSKKEILRQKIGSKKGILRQKIGSKKGILRQKIGSKKEDPSTNLVDIKRRNPEQKTLQTLTKSRL